MIKLRIKNDFLLFNQLNRKSASVIIEKWYVLKLIEVQTIWDLIKNQFQITVLLLILKIVYIFSYTPLTTIAKYRQPEILSTYHHSPVDIQYINEQKGK